MHIKTISIFVGYDCDSDNLFDNWHWRSYLSFVAFVLGQEFQKVVSCLSNARTQRTSFSQKMSIRFIFYIMTTLDLPLELHKTIINTWTTHHFHAILSRVVWWSCVARVGKRFVYVFHFDSWQSDTYDKQIDSWLTTKLTSFYSEKQGKIIFNLLASRIFIRVQ